LPPADPRLTDPVGGQTLCRALGSTGSGLAIVVMDGHHPIAPLRHPGEAVASHSAQAHIMRPARMFPGSWERKLTLWGEPTVSPPPRRRRNHERHQ